VRIVPDSAKFNLRDKTKVGHFKSYEPTFDVADTIEITDDDWFCIFHSYFHGAIGKMSFAQYIRELIQLKREVKNER
jgi:hypothetical protein